MRKKTSYHTALVVSAVLCLAFGLFALSIEEVDFAIGLALVGIAAGIGSLFVLGR